MITATTNADGTTTITCDEITAASIWAHTWIAAQDADNNPGTRKRAAEIARAIDPRPEWAPDTGT